MSGDCFHCGLPLAEDTIFITINAQPRPLCCLGCKAVAEAIMNSGLASYYEFRDQKSMSQYNLIPPELLELEQYDQENVQAKYLLTDDTDDMHTQSIILSIEGISCAACVWLLEKRVKTIEGVQRFTVNLSTHRAELCFNETICTLSRILREIAKIGFRAIPFELDQAERHQQQVQQAALKRLAVSGIGFGQVMMFSIPFYEWFSHGISADYRDFFRIMIILVATPVIVYCGTPFFRGAWRSLKSRYLSMDVSISLAILVIYSAGLYATLLRTGEVYFDTMTMLIFFITLSRYLEMRVRYHASFIAQKLRHQAPNWMTRLTGEGEEIVTVNQLKPNDHIIIKPGTTIPVDGEILSGQSSVSEAMLTGEAHPKAKSHGDAVLAGSLNIDHPLTIKVTRCDDNTALATIMKLFERAQYERPKIISLAQRFAHYFVLLQVALAIILFIKLLPLSITQAFWGSITLLVICCPCALALATPIALTAAMNALSKRGFLCTRGHVLEGLAKATDIVFDKTGTLTHGQFSIVQCDIISEHAPEFIQHLASSLEAHSEHPIASAFKYAERNLVVENCQVHPNQGIEGDIKGEHYFLGNPHFISKKLNHVDATQDSSTHTTVWLANSSGIMAKFGLDDKLRDNTTGLIQLLKEQGYQVHLLSGDNANAVIRCANEVKIHQYRANLSPQEKLQYVKELQDKGATVVMFGDGMNDAPVLMQAQISVAMANAADVTRVNADAILMKSDLMILGDILKHAQKTRRVIQQCLSWAVIYNIFSVPLAFSGLIAPSVAAVLMSLSSITVVANASRLMKIRQSPKVRREILFALNEQ